MIYFFSIMLKKRFKKKSFMKNEYVVYLFLVIDSFFIKAYFVRVRGCVYKVLKTFFGC